MDIIQVVKSIQEDKGIDFQDKGKYTEIVVAEHVAYLLSIPATPLEEVAMWFRANLKVSALQEIGKANEITVLDIDRTVELVFSIWLIRYNVVHRMNDARTGRLLSHVVASDYITLQPKTIELLKRYANKFTSKAVVPVT
ncbi:MAG: hypothetical protein IBX57_00295 [Gammaproteobacteria bacterium]|nr:hypothetical protein [Gammaproteobacteria bacterium]